ncbi:MAG: BON domain-containing protein [Planctomycetes bacterium]|nr:BON domain-containing protein [Planctomycetota bacterium]
MMIASRSFLLPFCLTMTPLASACALAQEPQSAPVQDQETPSDGQVVDAVEDELRLDPAVSSRQVAVQADDGVVTLTGMADCILAADRAADVARTVRGVRAVVDRIEVVPPADIGRVELRQSVEQALLANPATDLYQVQVEADDAGAVTLKGTVESWAERQLCEQVAAGVAGVTEVDDEIAIHYVADRVDSEICRDVEQRLHWNILVDDGLIDVSCKDGEVALSGIVGSAAERIRARRLAWIAGVKDVDVEGLQVARWARDDKLRGSKYAVRSNDQVREAVKDALRLDPRVASFAIDVGVSSGHVTLRGDVDNLEALRAAAEDARNTVGVSSVVNRIHVRPEPTRSGVQVANEIESALQRDPFVDADEVSVTVHNGVARLFGCVDDCFVRARADDDAACVPGVVDVENLVAVRDATFHAFDPYVDATPLECYGWFRYEPWLTFDDDGEIAARVEEELWWSPFVNSGDVAVTCVDGVVQLDGEVGSETERIAATENAFDAGAIWVDNDLEVMPDEGSKQ